MTAQAAFYFDLRSPCPTRAERALSVLPAPCEWQPILAALPHAEPSRPIAASARRRSCARTSNGGGRARAAAVSLADAFPFDSRFAMLRPPTPNVWARPWRLRSPPFASLRRRNALSEQDNVLMRRRVRDPSRPCWQRRGRAEWQASSSARARRRSAWRLRRAGSARRRPRAGRESALEQAGALLAEYESGLAYADGAPRERTRRCLRRRPPRHVEIVDVSPASGLFWDCSRAKLRASHAAAHRLAGGRRRLHCRCQRCGRLSREPRTTWRRRSGTTPPAATAP